MAEYQETFIHGKENPIFVLKTVDYKISGAGTEKRVIFDDRMASLQDVITVRGREFKDIPWEMIWFPTPRLDSDGQRDLIVKARTKLDYDTAFQSSPSSSALRIVPYITLIDVIRTAEEHSFSAMNSIRLFWYGDAFCIEQRIEKTPT